MLINKILRRLGLEKVNKHSSKYPYQKSYKQFNTLFKLWIPDKTAQLWYDIENFKNFKELELIAERLDENDHIIEVGVHYGYFAVFMNKLLKSGSYVGVELMSKCVMYAHSNFYINEIKNATLLNLAASSLPNKQIQFHPDPSGNAFITKNQSSVYVAETTTVDEISNEFKRKFSVLKIDVEGHELEVLKGAKQTLSRKPKIFLELHLNQLTFMDRKEIIDLINIDSYDGVMYMRDSAEIKPLSIDLILSYDKIINLFLSPIIQSN